MSAALDNLKEAAINYGNAKASLLSASDCHAPISIIIALEQTVSDMGTNLNDAATQYYDDTFDGAPES